MATIREFKINDIKYPVGNIRREADTLKNHLIAIFEDENLAGTVITANVTDTELAGIITVVHDYTENLPPPGNRVAKGFTILQQGEIYKVRIRRYSGTFNEPEIEKINTSTGDVIIEDIKFINNRNEDGIDEYIRLFPYYQNAELYIKTSPIPNYLVDRIKLTEDVKLVFYYPARSSGAKVKQKSIRNSYVFPRSYGDAYGADIFNITSREKLLITVAPGDIQYNDLNEPFIVKTIKWIDFLKNNAFWGSNLRLPQDVFSAEYGDIDLNSADLRNAGTSILGGNSLSDLIRARQFDRKGPISDWRYYEGYDYPRGANMDWTLNNRGNGLQIHFRSEQFTSSCLVGPADGVFPAKEIVSLLLNRNKKSIGYSKAVLFNPDLPAEGREIAAHGWAARYYSETGVTLRKGLVLFTRVGIAIANPDRLVDLENKPKVLLKKYSQCKFKISARIRFFVNGNEGFKNYTYLLTARSIIHKNISWK